MIQATPEYEEALKKIYSRTPKDNFMAITYEYNKSILLPYDDGLKFLACLKSAEMLSESYSKPKEIRPFQLDDFKTRVFSRKDYEDIKVANLLGVSVEELLAPTKPQE